MDSPSEKRVKNNLWAALLAVARAVATEDRLEPLLRAALAGLLAARDTTDSAMILLREPTAGRLELSAVQGNLDDPTRPAPAEIVAFLDDTGMAGDIPLPGVVCLPLRVGDTGLGYLALASDPSRPGPPQSDLPFLEDVVALLAQAIWTLREREALRAVRVVVLSANDLPQSLTVQQRGQFRVTVNRPLARQELADVLAAVLGSVPTQYE